MFRRPCERHRSRNEPAPPAREKVGYRPMTETQPDFVDVSRLLTPRSIAVVGASDTAGNVGGAAVRFLRKFGAPCEVWPINPGRETVAGLRCYPNVAALP